MKNILFVISLLFLSLLGIKTLNDAPLLVDGDGFSCVMEADDNSFSMDARTGYILPVSFDFQAGDMLAANGWTLAAQLRLMGRFCRSVVHSSIFSKVIAWRTALLRMEILSYSSSHFYSTLPYPSWKVASEYYIFGMRRILI